MQSFNPRSRAGSDVRMMSGAGTAKGFQSTLPCGERLGVTGGEAAHILFQSTLPCGERRRPDFDSPEIIIVSIHAPVRGATPIDPALKAQKRIVSIHAPVRGATRPLIQSDKRCHVSIHAPVRGATSGGRHPLLPAVCFNPRSRAGSDVPLWTL